MDPYKVLRISRGAKASEIKKAYQKLVFECHPDRHRGDKAKSEMFLQVQAAYTMLTKGAGGAASAAASTEKSWSSVRKRQWEQIKTTPPPAGQKAFDYATWRAWHYGDNAIVLDAVRQVSAEEGHSGFMNLKKGDEGYDAQQYFRRRQGPRGAPWEAPPAASAAGSSGAPEDAQARAARRLREKRERRRSAQEAGQQKSPIHTFAPGRAAATAAAPLPPPPPLALLGVRALAPALLAGGERALREDLRGRAGDGAP